MRRVGPQARRLVLLCSILLLVLFILVNNCTLCGGPYDRPQLLAHRGLAQTFDIAKVAWDTNTAAVIYPPEYPYIENTVPSMRAAFGYGADIVEFDIRVTKDKELAVFHDYLLDYRTEAIGRLSDYTLKELQGLDVGYGYTHDGGKTFPLRGTGVGLLPSFDQVMAEFPGKEFLVHIRDDGEEIGYILLEKLAAMSDGQLRRISIYGNDKAIDIIRSHYPSMKALSARMIKKAVVRYFLIGWTGYVPASMRNMEIHLPIEYARFLWGWPGRIVKRMDRVNTRFVIVKKRGQWSGGFDTQKDISEIPRSFTGCVWTERIDRVGPYYEAEGSDGRY